jgi:RNA polymerase sigma-70 factor (ECF subfamily)
MSATLRLGTARWLRAAETWQTGLAADCRLMRAPVQEPIAPPVDVERAVAGDPLAATLRAVVARDADALAALYDATIGRVHAVSRAILRDEHDAEEVSCDVYTQVWSTAARYDASRGPVLAWLLTIARSRALDRLRARGVRARFFVPMDAPDEAAAEVAPAPDSALALLERESEVRRALEDLTEERRRLVLMAYFGDMSHGEIAAATGLPLGTVKSHLRRALFALREALETRGFRE